jgi:hypothetical protein
MRHTLCIAVIGGDDTSVTGKTIASAKMMSSASTCACAMLPSRAHCGALRNRLWFVFAGRLVRARNATTARAPCAQRLSRGGSSSVAPSAAGTNATCDCIAEAAPVLRSCEAESVHCSDAKSRLCPKRESSSVRSRRALSYVSVPIVKGLVSILTVGPETSIDGAAPPV